MTAETICELNNVSRAFGKRRALNNLTLSINRNEIVALMGPSGAGKSSTLNIIGLLDTADSGSVKLFGRTAPKVGSGRAQKILRTRLGYLFQNAALIDRDTVDANLKIAQSYSKESGKEKREEALSVVGLTGFGKRRVYELSGGEQQRVALARLLLKPCELILADEPTGSLDPTNRDHVLNLLEHTRTQEKTVIIVTHDRTVGEACDRIITIADNNA